MQPLGQLSTTLRVATLNAGSLIEPGWDERRHEQLAWLEHLDADVVCLQEIWESETLPNTAGWLVDHAPPGRWHWRFGGFPVPRRLRPDPTVRFGSAILSRWPIDACTLHRLPVDETEDVDDIYRLELELLHVRTNGIDVFSTHLAPPPLQGYHRIHQVVAIDRTIQAAADPHAVLPPILCGDFNAEPDSDEIRFLCSLATVNGRNAYYQDAWRVAGRTDPGFTQDRRTNPLADRLNVPIKRIDYVFVGNPFRRPQGAGLVLHTDLAFHEPLTGVLASDHYGVVTEIRWPQRSGAPA